MVRTLGTRTKPYQQTLGLAIQFMWGTVAHWLEHWTHDHKVVGTSHDSSSLC